VATSFRIARATNAASRIPGQFDLQLGVLIAVGAFVRLALATLLVHRSYDMTSVSIVNSTLRAHLTALYETKRWPYPGGMLPWVLASGTLAHHTGADISFWFKLPTIAADGLIAWLVQAYLGLRGASQNKRLVAAALVCLGPSFIAISGYEGQIDALAILPGVAALYLWERSSAKGSVGTRTELLVALMIGAGAAVKTVPLLLALAFVPRIRGWLGRLRFCAVATAIPLLSILPWLITKPDSLAIVVKYKGIGVGPLALAVQPTLAKDFLTAHATVQFDALSTFLEHHGKIILYIALAVVTFVLLLRRPRPERAAVLLWLCAYAFMPFFFFQYVIWGLPFLLMAGYIREIALAQAILLIPTALWEGRTWDSVAVVWPYAILMTVAWAWALVSFGVQTRHTYRTT
jgi:hypothetical protein